MDPNFFRVDLERTFEVMTALVLLSLFVERALALVFEHRAFIERFEGKGIKPIIAFFVALIVCRYWQFDAVSVIVLAEEMSWPGYILTAAVIAGGSKVSIKLFHDVLKIMSTAEEERQVRKRAALNREALAAAEPVPAPAPAAPTTTAVERRTEDGHQ